MLALRKLHDLTQTELADKTGVDPSFISQMERDKRMPSPILLAKLAQLLHTSTDYLLMVTDDPRYPGEQDHLDRFMSQEADAVGQIIDSLSIPARETVSNVAHALADYERMRNVEEWERLLDIVESVLGVSARAQIESALIERSRSGTRGGTLG